MPTKDLGTYHVKVELNNGDGFIMKWETGIRYTDGWESSHPLTAELISPAYEDEEGLKDTIRYMFLHGDFAYAYNIELFLDQAHQRNCDSTSACSNKYKIIRMTLIKPDATEEVIYAV